MTALLAAVIAMAVVPTTARAAHAYVSNEDDASVTVVDTDRLAAVATFEVGKRPRGLVLSRDGSTLYVAVSGLPKCPPPIPTAECAKLPRDPSVDGIAVIDTSSGRRTRLIKGVSDPERVELSPDGRTLYVTNEDASRLTILDAVRGTVLANTSIGNEPEGVRASASGALVLTTSEEGNSVAIVDARTYAVLHTVKVGKRPRDVVFAPRGGSAFVTGEADASVWRVPLPSGADAAPLLHLRPATRPMGMALDATRRRLYVTTGHGGTVAVIGLDDGNLIKEIPVGARPWGIALTPDRRRLVTANGPSGDVAIVDTDTLSVIGKVKAGRGPWGVVVGP